MKPLPLPVAPLVRQAVLFSGEQLRNMAIALAALVVILYSESLYKKPLFERSLKLIPYLQENGQDELWRDCVHTYSHVFVNAIFVPFLYYFFVSN